MQMSPRGGVLRPGPKGSLATPGGLGWTPAESVLGGHPGLAAFLDGAFERWFESRIFQEEKP